VQYYEKDAKRQKRRKLPFDEFRDDEAIMRKGQNFMKAAEVGDEDIRHGQCLVV
jgi:hypothetical protein